MRLCVVRLLFTGFLISGVYAFSPDDIHSYTLENGLRLFVLTDTTSAAVRIELDVYAGYSAQSETTAGFFPLYARLLSLSAGEAEAGADCVRLVRTVAPLAVEETLTGLSAALRPLSVTDGELRTALNAMKAEVTEYASSAAGFINTAIDARVFPDAPWKQESGVYPAIFTAQTVPSARTVLNRVGTEYYTAPNAALFISGNITQEGAVSLAGRTFSGVRSNQPPVYHESQALGSGFGSAARSALPGTASSSASSGAATGPASSSPAPAGSSASAVGPAAAAPARKYILHDAAFSPDMTQIVVQYTDFTRDQADVLAAALNDDRSAFKASLAADKTLGILGAEYINVASAQKRASSRLIIQSLLEKTKTSPCVQAETFLRAVEEASSLSERSLSEAVSLFRSSFFQRQDDSASLMELAAAFFASTGSADWMRLFSRADSLSQFSAAELSTVQRLQKPAVFVLVNSAVYKKRAAEFKKAGYTPVTSANGSWYTQALYKARLTEASLEAEREDVGIESAREAVSRFISGNSADFSGFTLSNAIPVTVKKNPGSQTVALMLTIAGGELLFADKTPGLCTLLADSLALSIRRAIAPEIDCSITAETTASFSRICITCASTDLAECIRGAGFALIYSDITPAMADGIAYDERTQWRLKTGTATFQLLCEAVRTAFSAPYTKLFNDKDDKPASSIEFTRIAAAYPVLLDASRYSLIVSGGLPESVNLQELLETHFGVLVTQKATESKEKSLAVPKLPKKSKSVKLRHLFLTDVSADKAGPRPAILIPTKTFYDPLLYCLPSPDAASTDSALFNALLYELEARLKDACGSEKTVRLDCADDDIPFARLSVSNVVRTSQIDSLYAETVRTLKADIEALLSGEAFSTDGAKPALLVSMENRWLLRTLADSGTAGGQAKLIQTSLARGKDPQLYLKQYQTVNKALPQDYYIIAQAYLDEVPPLRLYSADSKK